MNLDELDRKIAESAARLDAKADVIAVPVIRSSVAYDRRLVISVIEENGKPTTQSFQVLQALGEPLPNATSAVLDLVRVGSTLILDAIAAKQSRVPQPIFDALKMMAAAFNSVRKQAEKGKPALMVDEKPT